MNFYIGNYYKVSYKTTTIAYEFNFTLTSAKNR